MKFTHILTHFLFVDFALLYWAFSTSELGLFMIALWNRADRYIFALWFLLLSFFLFFPHLISAVADWMSAILRHMVWP